MSIATLMTSLSQYQASLDVSTKHLGMPIPNMAAGKRPFDHQIMAFQAVLGVQEDRTKVHVVQGPTGSGKTLVASMLAAHFCEQGYNVLWLTNNWQLNRHLDKEFRSVFPQYSPKLRRIGGSKERLDHLAEDGQGQIFVSTLQTWDARVVANRLPSRVERNSNLLVISDECHWAYRAQTGREFRRYYLPKNQPSGSNPLVVGFSATPVDCAESMSKVVFSVPFVSLIGVRLARPRIKSVKTGIAWDPILRKGIVTQESLRQLANSTDRNEMIVRELVAGRQAGDYSKILVFACNINHAERLQKMISTAGVPSVAVHSKQSKAEQQEGLQNFESGRVAVLINVSQFSTGFDMPSIDAVFIARPTTSKTPLMQMLGRGSRRTKTKLSFWIVEFTDTIKKHAEEFFHVSQLYIGSERPDREQTIQCARPQRHDEEEQVRLEDIQLPGIGAITIVPGQTFGVEIELTTRDWGIPKFASQRWKKTASEIIDRLKGISGLDVLESPTRYHAVDEPTLWKVEHDSSAGWEIVSPILRGEDGFRQLQLVCDELTQLVADHPQLHLNHKTGLHITLATRLSAGVQLEGFVRRVQRLEPGLMTLVSPSRLYEYTAGLYSLDYGNNYCLPLRDADACQHSNRNLQDRYHTVNLTKAWGSVQKLEVRMHNGTTEFRKLGPWISLWMLIFNNSRYAWEGNGVTEEVFPGGNVEISSEAAKSEDIFSLLAREGIFLHQEMRQQLWNRRLQLRNAWSQAVPRRVESWGQAGWYTK